MIALISLFGRTTGVPLSDNQKLLKIAKKPRRDNSIQEYKMTEDLLDDEITARIYQVGAFSVRISKNACEEGYPDILEERTPVSTEVIQILRKAEKERQAAERRASEHGIRIETVVSACKHSGIAAAENYQYICHAQEA